ncbi:tetratricopeptide repeat protein [Psychrobacillus sp. FSL H8-0510]|uniref:tetratricopeptide repeat protein n=1 Tax=Psychrobacillus sp. FSL H8-0510 TaxID=2921394 RepID=UPI0030F63156
MKIKDVTVRFMVAVLVALVLIGLGYASLTGNKQDNEMLTEQASFNQALKYIEDEHFNQALQLMKSVERDYSSSHVVKYYIGSTLANLGEWKSAAMVYQKVLDLNPYMVEDSTFMIQYANILINAEKLKEAKEVLVKCKSLPIPDQMPNYLNQVDTLLTNIQ